MVASNVQAYVHKAAYHPGQYAIIALTLLVSIYLLHATAVAFTPSLRFIPGPSIARFTPLYRPWMIRKGDAPSFYRKLHQMYGSLVRTGPRKSPIQTLWG